MRYRLRSLPFVFLFLSFAKILAATEERSVLTQWSTIDALLEGYYQRVTTLEEAIQHGDFGLGTLEHLNGELLILEGKAYQIDSHGKVNLLNGHEQTPFIAVTQFNPSIELEIPAGITLIELQNLIDVALPSRNLFYALRIDGAFTQLRTRSVPAQSPPYPRLADVVKNQATFDFTQTTGTLVGFWCPSYAQGINVPGYHFHYLSLDKQQGGHLLGLLTGENVRVQIAVLRDFSLKLPNNPSFDHLNLDGNRSEELHGVESERR